MFGNLFLSIKIEENFFLRDPQKLSAGRFDVKVILFLKHKKCLNIFIHIP